MKVIGITGLTGSGKSTIAEALFNSNYIENYNQCYLFDCDLTYHELIKPYKPCWQELVNTFGSQIVNQETNEINRKILAEIAFNTTPENKEKLNSIAWKHVRNKFNQIMEEYDGNTLFIIDAPLLFPAGLDKICDNIIITETALSKRLERIIKRDNLTEEQALRRINAQPLIDNKGRNILRINTEDCINSNILEKIINFIEKE